MPSTAPKAPRGETRARVAELDEQGLSAREIARELEITTQAVYHHLQSLAEEVRGIEARA